MAKTKIEDVFVPEVWEQYFIERTAELANFGASGIIGSDAQFNSIASGPGTTAEMPFWQDISGARQVLSDTNALTTNKIGASKDTCRIHNDGNAWSTNLLAGLLAGSDGMDAIVQLVGAYWARVDEAMLVATVKGVLAQFDSQSGDPGLLKIASESVAATGDDTVLTGFTYLDAKQKLGDQKDRLTAIAVHSATQTDLEKQGLITEVTDTTGKVWKAFAGLRVVQDDDLPSRAGTTDGLVYTSVLFGTGAVARGFAPLTTPVDGGFGTEAVERSRVSLNSDSVLINRRRHIMHPRGVAWVEAPTGSGEDQVDETGGPSDAELALAEHWAIKYEQKNIRIVGIYHNLGSQIPAAS